MVIEEKSKFKTYSTNFGFRNIYEFKQFCWLKNILDKEGNNEYKLCHNFYMYDPQGDEVKFREIDFGLISNRYLFILEHKYGRHRALEFQPRINSIYHRFMRFFRDQGIDEYPWIEGKMIARDDRYRYEPRARPSIINTEKDTASFYRDEIMEQAPRYPISQEAVTTILEKLNCMPYEYRQINEPIFDIFEELRCLNGQRLSDREGYSLVNKVYEHFSPINLLLSNVFLLLEEEHQKDKTVYNPIFHFHTMSPQQILGNRYPIYWACSTNLQETDVTSQLQLGFHISNEDWYSRKKDKRKHITIKLLFYRTINKQDFLVPLQNKLKNRRAEFERLLLKLNEDDDQRKFVFFRSIRDRHDIEERPINNFTANQIIDLIVNYDNGDSDYAIPRTTEFIKVYDWTPEIEKVFARKKRAQEFLEVQFRKLMELYKFMNDVSD